MKFRLMAMMFLQFFIWGSWYATGGNYMRAHGMSEVIYLAYLVSPVGSIISPFFLGMIADRYYPVQKVMGVMHLASGLFVMSAPWLGENHPALFLTLLLFHMLCYMPTVSLAAAASFHLLPDRERDYPLVRLFGTLGWIGAGIIVSYVLHGDTAALPMYVAGAGGLLMGLYSFTLPDIPPPGAGRKFSIRDVVGWEALTKLYSRPFVIFIAGLLLISIPFASYFAYVPIFLGSTGVSDPAFRMTYGQMSEIFFLLMMPWLFRVLGIKWVMVAGLFAWSARYALFAVAAPGGVLWMLTVGILLHGACYDFVYVASQVYIDRNATPEIRAQAQGFFVLISYGIGQGLGTLTAGWIFNSIMTGGSGSPAQWQSFWTVPLLFSVVVTALFLFGFSEKRKPASAMAG